MTSMTIDQPGAAGTRGGTGMSTIKRGDRVWIRRPVRNVDVNRKNGKQAIRCVGISTWDVDVLPDSPALPKIAAWLAEHPDARASVVRALVALDLVAVRHDDLAGMVDHDSTVFRALVAALDGGEGDQ